MAVGRNGPLGTAVLRRMASNGSATCGAARNPSTTEARSADVNAHLRSGPQGTARCAASAHRTGAGSFRFVD